MSEVSAIRRSVSAVLQLRRGERAIALWMAGYHFVLLVTLYLLKPVRDSVFLTGEGAGGLPFVFMLVAVAVAPVSVLYDRAGRSVRLNRLVYGVTVFLVLNIVALRFLVELDQTWVRYLLYVWVSIFGVLVTSQFWLMANAVFDAAQAKRVFVLLGLGAILGAVAGGEITGLLVDGLGMRTADLLIVAAALLAVTMLAVVRIQRHPSAAIAPPVADPEGVTDEERLFSVIGKSRHLRLIVGVIVLTVVATTLVDYQFKTVAADAYPSEDGLTTFMGRFYGRVSFIAFLLQLLLGAKLLSRIGIGGTVVILPLGLAIASVGVLVWPGLVAATILRGTDQTLKHSVDKTARELLFMPVPLDVKKRVKVFIDLFVDQGAQGLAGALLLLFTAGMGMGVRGLSVIVIALLAAWCITAGAAYRSYVQEFRRMLRNPSDRTRDDEGRTPGLAEWVSSLTVSSEREIVRGLSRFERRGERVPEEVLDRLLDHDVSEVRRRAVRLMRLQHEEGHLERVATFLEDPDAEVRVEAARYLYQHLPDDRLPLLEEGLESPDFRIRAAGLGLITKDGGPEERALVSEQLLSEMLDYEGEDRIEIRSEVARVLGALRGRPFQIDMLWTLLRDPDPHVVRHAIESAGYSGERDFVPRLVKLMQEDAYRDEARRALSLFGDRVIGTFYDLLADERVSEVIRLSIPEILATRRVQPSVDVLVMSLDRVSLPVRKAVVETLCQLHGRAPDLRLNEGALRTEVFAEIDRHSALQRCRSVLRAYRSMPLGDVETAEADSLERLFRLLGLLFGQKDLYNAYRAVVSDDRALRAGAIELLDNLLDYEVKRRVLPLLDTVGRDGGARSLQQWFSPIRSEEDALAYLLEERDPRLRGPAIRLAVRSRSRPLMAQVEAMTDDPDPSVRRIAIEALGRPLPDEVPQEARAARGG